MAEMPDFIREAIKAQGKYAPEEIEEKLDALEPDTLLGVVEPEEDEEVEDEQEVLDLGPVEPAEHS